MVQNKKNRKRFFVVDGYALLFRAHFALIRNPLITSYGLDTSALFGFVNQIFKLIRTEKPDYFACAFDSKGKTFRNQIYDDYKANRPEMPNELQLQLPHLWEILEIMNIPVLKKSGFEADDIIGTLAVQAEKEGLDTYIVSGDKDFMQLINENIFLYSPGTKKSPGPKVYDSHLVMEKWGVPPDKVIDLLGLMGDSSDNVPGVPGVGEKTAVKLINAYGSLEGALDNAEKISNKRVREGLTKGVEKANLSKKLVTILVDLKLDCNVKDFEKKAISTEACILKFQSLEFQGLAKQLSTSLNVKSQDKKIDRPIINCEVFYKKRDVDVLARKLLRSKLVSVSIITDGKSASEATILGFSFATVSDNGWYVPVANKELDDKKPNQDNLSWILKKLKPILENDEVLKTGCNIKYDLHLLKRFGINIGGYIFDISIAAHLINPSSKVPSLKSLSLEYLNYELSGIEDLSNVVKNQQNIYDISLEDISNYSVEKSFKILELTQILKNELEKKSLSDYFDMVELPLVPILVEMEYNGVYVDSNLIRQMSKDIGGKLDDLKKNIFRQSKKDFNINSTQQLAIILFDELDLPMVKKRSTAEDVLKKLKDYHEIPQLILDYRKYNKLKNTYLDSLLELIHHKTSRVHSTFNQTIAATGRLSSTKPNFQNIPIRTREGREVRKAFSAQKRGWKIFSADYSQVELRIMAHFSKDKALIDAFNNEEDIHTRTASLVFNVPIENVLSDMRRTAKIVNFGIMYGAGAFRLSQELGISRNNASQIIADYFKKYPGIQEYINNTLEKARNLNYVETILGRRRPILDANSSNALKRKAAERMAINMPIQGSAAEMIKLAMINIQREIKNMNLKSKLVLQIHDELLFEFPESEEDVVIELVTKKMESAIQLEVPVVVDYGIGTSWFDAH